VPNALKPVFAGVYFLTLIGLLIVALLALDRPVPTLGPMGLLIAALSPLVYFFWLVLARPQETEVQTVLVSVFCGLGVVMTMVTVHRFGEVHQWLLALAALVLVGWLACLRGCLRPDIAANVGPLAHTEWIQSIVFWSLMVFLIPQALWVRRRAQRFPPAEGAREGRAGAGPPLRLLALGDSIIDGVGARTLDRALVGQTVGLLADRSRSNIEWQALGRSGLGTDDVRKCLQASGVCQAADCVVVSVGVNDVTRLRTCRAWKRSLHELLTTLKAHSPDAVVVMAGLPPFEHFPALPQPLRALLGLRGYTFHQTLKQVASEYSAVAVVEVDFEGGSGSFSADGFHPSEASYGVFAKAVVGEIEKLRLGVNGQGLCEGDQSA
jgi:lysophospholipase L1-like esterase